MRTMLRWLVVGLVLVLIFGLASCRTTAWKVVKYKVHHDFPNVRRIQTAELAEWLADSHRKPPLLLDVRTRAEFEVSHLHGAAHIEPDASADELTFDPGKPIVTYCSVGYRSAAFAQRLQERGFKNVQNLDGSIFAWANEGRPIERDGRPANKVHPYNQRWGRLLKTQLRVAP